VLLVNALGMSVLLLSPLARHLAATYHVISWESRGLPDLSGAAPDDDLSIARHAEDAADVLGRTRAHAIVSYCSGINVAAYALAREILTTSRLCVLSPSIELPDPGGQTDYQRTMLPIWRSIAASGLRQAGLIQQLLLDSRPALPPGRDAELHEINNLPFQSADGTYRYARMQASCLDQASLPDLASLTADTLVIHCRQDDLIHADTARQLASAIPASGYRELDDAGHFGIYTSAQLHRQVANFVSDPRPDRVRATACAAPPPQGETADVQHDQQ
jgi:pimeloyl-ACP methyl ester carboxylesterase